MPAEYTINGSYAATATCPLPGLNAAPPSTVSL